VSEERESTSLAVKVSSAVPLTKEEQEALREKLQTRFGQDLSFRFEVEPSILGGVLLRVGDDVIDGSVQGKLETLRQTLAPSR